MPVSVVTAGSTNSPLFFPGAEVGEIQIPALVTSEPTTAEADTIHLQLQHIKLRG